jgi:hypothetical protein
MKIRSAGKMILMSGCGVIGIGAQLLDGLGGGEILASTFEIGHKAW